MPSPDWIEFEGKTSKFLEMIEMDVEFSMNRYHALVQYAARYRKAMANPRGLKVNYRVDLIWHARQASRAILASAAANVAAAKAMRKAEEIHLGAISTKGNVSGGGGGMNLDG